MEGKDEEAASEDATTSPLLDEIWAVVAGKLDDSSDIFNMIQVFPVLEGALEESKRHWVFDRILPHVSKWLTKNELLGCRKVCRRWRHAVDNFLQHHPYLRAYSHENPVTGQIWTSEEGYPVALYGSWEHLPTTSFSSNAEALDFISRMGRESNPFLNRQVVINILWPEDGEVITGASEIIREFGKHIWYLRINDDHPNAPPDPQIFHQVLKEWMDQLPNLKGLLFLAAWMEGDHLAEAWSEVSYQLPTLPNLETLHIAYDTLPPPLVQAFFSSYSHQLRRLTFAMTYWNRGLYSAFPKLTELWVSEISTEEEMTDLLLSIQAPLLYDLVLESSSNEDFNVAWTILISSLKRFPLLRNLTLPSRATVLERIKGDFIPGLDSIPPVKFLSIGKVALCHNPDFLLCFPNLGFLNIAHSYRNSGAPPSTPTVNIWTSLANLWLYESNVWELLPKLRGIYVELDDTMAVGADEEGPYQFKRETYEYRRKVTAASAGARVFFADACEQIQLSEEMGVGAAAPAPAMITS